MSDLTFGFPKMRKEPGERRDFLPGLMAWIHQHSGTCVVEHGYGIGMGITEDLYKSAHPELRFVSHEEAYQQDYVVVLRCPDDEELRLMHPGACLISMLHYPTRPTRVAFLRSLGLEAISLDSLKDDSGKRVVENLEAVAWNGIEAAFDVLKKTYPAPGLEHPNRLPIQVTLLGSGGLASQVIRAATRYGNEKYHRKLAAKNCPGIIVTVIDYDVTDQPNLMKNLLRSTDILVDATQRPDPSKVIIPNEWLAYLPVYAVILDLSVDPYDFSTDPPEVKGIEGIPHGNLDQFTFCPDDPAFDLLPLEIPCVHRRHVVSCYSWPGVYPRECMERYGLQLRPVIRKLIEKRGVKNISPHGTYFERAIARAQLSRFEQAVYEAHELKKPRTAGRW